MNELEQLLCEEINIYFENYSKFGAPERPKDDDVDNAFQNLHEHINDLFAIKASDLIHYDNVCSTFRKIHNHLYITDPRFELTLSKELDSRGVPSEEKEKALGLITKIISEVKGVGENWKEQDAGYHPNLKNILNKQKD